MLVKNETAEDNQEQFVPPSTTSNPYGGLL